MRKCKHLYGFCNKSPLGLFSEFINIDLRAGIRNARPGSVILCQKPTIFYSGARGEGLACSERAENIINRKIGTFYIEAIP